MAGKDVGTEQLIKDTARKVFFIEGKLHATTQDIADAAGINRTSLHYYFRTKNDLVKQIYDEAKGELTKNIKAILGSSLPFREKVENFISAFFEYVTGAPYLQSFLINEMNCKSQTEPQLFPMAKSTPPEIRLFLNEISHEIEKGTIMKTSPENFMINLFSLISYPIIMKPFYLDFFELSPEKYQYLMRERKQMILALIFNNNQVN